MKKIALLLLFIGLSLTAAHLFNLPTQTFKERYLVVIILCSIVVFLLPIIYGFVIREKDLYIPGASFEVLFMINTLGAIAPVLLALFDRSSDWISTYAIASGFQLIEAGLTWFAYLRRYEKEELIYNKQLLAILAMLEKEYYARPDTIHVVEKGFELTTEELMNRLQQHDRFSREYVRNHFKFA